MMAAPRKKSYQPGAKGALDGVRVLDLSRLVAGNTLTQVLGDFGADVIKVEPPAGDTLRAWQTKGVPVTWKLYSRSKKSLCLELRRSEAIELLVKLIPSAAIFIESFRPGILEKMGLAPTTLLARNPKLVVVRISGWGQDGRRGTGNRPAAARAALQHPRTAGGKSSPYREGKGADRKSLHHHRAAQCVSDERRALGMPVRVDPENGRAPVPRHRPAGARRRSPLRDQLGTPAARRPARRHHRRLYRAQNPGRKCRVLREIRSHHRAGLRHRADSRGSARDRARARRRLSRSRHGHLSH